MSTYLAMTVGTKFLPNRGTGLILNVRLGMESKLLLIEQYTV